MFYKKFARRSAILPQSSQSTQRNTKKGPIGTPSVLSVFSVVLILFVTAACQKERKPKEISSHAILRASSDHSLPPLEQKAGTPPSYPWQKEQGVNLRAITKEFFRCRGSSVNPPRIVMDGAKEVNRFYDCGGADKHSLPLLDGKENVYSILIELLNEVQRKSKMPVIITSGHRCPVHQAFIDSSPKASCSKHLIGAQVSFYVQGLEMHPERVVQILFEYYKTRYKDKNEFCQFARYEKERDIETLPWYNKEVFIKLYKKHEGRDFDNRHPYAYLSIQVRFDSDKNERVAFSPERAQKLLRK